MCPSFLGCEQCMEQNNGTKYEYKTNELAIYMWTSIIAMMYTRVILYKHPINSNTTCWLWYMPLIWGIWGDIHLNIDANFPEHTDIIINHFLYEKMKNRNVESLGKMRIDISSHHWLYCSSFVCLDTPLMRVITLVHFPLHFYLLNPFLKEEDVLTQNKDTQGCGILWEPILLI